MKTYTWTTSLTPVEQLSDVQALLFNDSGLAVEVVNVSYMPPTAGDFTVIGVSHLRRISAVVGGTVLPPMKLDTAAPALPAEVLVVARPDSVTPVIPDCAFRSLVPAANLSQTIAGTPLATRQSLRIGEDSSSVMRHADVTGVTEAIVLREGEGVALILASPEAATGRIISMVVKNMSTGRSYVCRTNSFSPSMVEGAYLAAFNGVGSGAVISVETIRLLDTGPPSLSTLRLAKVDGIIHPIPLPSVETAAAHDSSTPMPSGIKLYSGPSLAALAGSGVGVLQDWHMTHVVLAAAAQQQYGSYGARVLSKRAFLDPATAGGPPPPDRGEYNLFSARPGNGVLVRRGEGFAVLTGRAGVFETSLFAAFDIRIRFTVMAGIDSSGISRSRIVARA